MPTGGILSAGGIYAWKMKKWTGGLAEFAEAKELEAQNWSIIGRNVRIRVSDGVEFDADILALDPESISPLQKYLAVQVKYVSPRPKTMDPDHAARVQKQFDAGEELRVNGGTVVEAENEDLVGLELLAEQITVEVSIYASGYEPSAGGEVGMIPEDPMGAP